MVNAIKWSTPAAIATLLSTGLNSLANGSRAISSAITDNREQYADFELVVTFGSAPAADSPIYLYFIKQIDGTNYEDGSTSLTPSAAPDVIFTVRAVTSAQREIRSRVVLPNGTFEVLLVNASGQAMAASGNTLKWITYCDEIQ